MNAKGTTVLAVGDKFPTSKGGFVILSKDGGETWTDLTPMSKIGAMSEVWLFDDGTAFIGAGSAKAWKVSGIK